MPGNQVKHRLQNLVLERRGLTRRPQGRLVPALAQSEIDAIYTPRTQPFVRNRVNPLLTISMQLLEYRFNTPIEKLLAPHLPLNVVADRLGIDFTTVSKWRGILGLRKGTNGTTGSGRLPQLDPGPSSIDPGGWAAS